MTSLPIVERTAEVLAAEVALEDGTISEGQVIALMRYSENVTETIKKHAAENFCVSIT